MKIKTHFSDPAIREMFGQYVAECEDLERHSKVSCHEAEVFDAFCEQVLPDNTRAQIQLYDKMMNTAVDFEEDGFVAGFKYAMKLLSRQEDDLPKEPQITTPEKKTSKQEATTKPKEQIKPVLTTYIDTTEIAEIYGRTNFKTCRTIRECILPYISEDEKAGFVEETIRTHRKKEQRIYKLSFLACKRYLEYAETKEYCTSFKEGNEKFRRKMEETFCSACTA